VFPSNERPHHSHLLPLAAIAPHRQNAGLLSKGDPAEPEPPHQHTKRFAPYLKTGPGKAQVSRRLRFPERTPWFKFVNRLRDVSTA